MSLRLKGGRVGQGGIAASAGPRSAVVALLFVVCLSVPSLAQLITDDYSYLISRHRVTDIFFSDSTRGWLAVLDDSGGGSHIFRTRDGGRTWRQRAGPPGLYLLYFSGPRSGWGIAQQIEAAAGVGHDAPARPDRLAPAYLVHTEDGGRTWTRVSTRPITQDRRASIWGLAFADRRRGWACGSGAYSVSVVLKTTDGGKSFRVPPRLPRNLGPCLGVYLSRVAGLWIYGAGFVLHSSDLGKSWERPSGITWFRMSPESSSAFSIFFLKDGRGWIVGYGPNWTILSTDDFGRNWHPALGNKNGTRLESVWFSDSGHGCAVGNSTALLCTADGGPTWVARHVLPAPGDRQADFFTRVVMLRSGLGWVLRAGGFLYQTTDGGQTWHPFDPLQQNNGP